MRIESSEGAVHTTKGIASSAITKKWPVSPQTVKEIGEAFLGAAKAVGVPSQERFADSFDLYKEKLPARPQFMLVEICQDWESV